MKKERILLLGGNFYPEPTGIGKYSGEMIDWLSAQGYECGVVTTYPYYPYWKVQAPYQKKAFRFCKEKYSLLDGAPVTIYRCPHYVPAAPSGKKRILSDLSFFLTAFFQVFVLLFCKKYDYVIATAPPFQVGLLGILYKKLRGSVFIYHVQDLQIDAAAELGMIRSKGLLQLMFGLERFILRYSDYVSTVSEGMRKKLQQKCSQSILLFPNWADTKNFYPEKNIQGLRSDYHFSSTDKIVLYSGAIGEKQGLDVLLSCAYDLRQRRDIKFVICGSGPYKNQLVTQANKGGLQNVFFLPLQPKENFNRFLNIADLHLVLQKGNASDLMMPSKLSTILSVGGLALVTADPGTNLHELIAANKLGLLTESDNRFALTDAILKALNEPHGELKKNARHYATEVLSLEKIAAGFFSEVLRLENKKGKAKISSNKKRDVNKKVVAAE